MKKRKLPLFVFYVNNVSGRKILEETEHTKTTAGEPILKTEKYNLFKDCNGVRIERSSK